MIDDASVRDEIVADQAGLLGAVLDVVVQTVAQPDLDAAEAPRGRVSPFGGDAG